MREAERLWQDYAKGMSLIQGAAKKGFPPAQFVLGSLYDNGKAGPRNEEEALKWYERAARQGHRDAATAAKLIQDRRNVYQEVKIAQAFIRYKQRQAKKYGKQRAGKLLIKEPNKKYNVKSARFSNYFLAKASAAKPLQVIHAKMMHCFGIKFE